ncbi:MAG: chemotaxis protein CheA, partial [Candidatus Omnitrophica bacterium]|nr:chemotaxis protein CheA [Candidatus Omnitrophota bacterium]
MEEMAKYKDTFLSEAREHVDSMNKSLLKLEKYPNKLELVSDIFREIHTLKSMSAAMDYNKTSHLCHAVEDVLDAIKKKKIKSDKCIDLLFESFDTLEASLKEIAKGKEEVNAERLTQKLQAILSTDEKIRDTKYEIRDTQTEKIQSIEVKVEKLDLLMRLAEELLITKMRLDRLKEELKNPELTAAVDTLERVVTDMQYNIMQSRMVPIGFVFNRFPRMVRDLAKQQKKEINLETKGSDIELDRGVIDEIGESLVHLIRNSIDHGIEPPEARKRTGKPSGGTVRLTATSTKNSAIIHVSDDGAGLDLEDIKNTAIKRGIISSGASKEEIIDSIFTGLSTTKQVTQISGRGFGLDIVKNKIESLGGTIYAETERKSGTSFTIEMPLTLAIIKTLFVEVGGKSYALPLVNIERLVTINQKDIKGMLNFEAIVLNEEDIPITRLDALFGAPSLNLVKQPIAIVRKGQEKLGLAV